MLMARLGMDRHGREGRTQQWECGFLDNNSSHTVVVKTDKGFSDETPTGTGTVPYSILLREDRKYG